MISTTLRKSRWEPLAFYSYGPFDNEEEAVNWANRNLQFFGTFEAPLEDPRIG